MSEVILGVIILSLIVWHYFDHREQEEYRAQAIDQLHDDYLKNLSENISIHEETVEQLRNIIKDLSRERQTEKENVAKLVNALIAKNAREAQDLGLVDKVAQFKQEPELPPDMIPVDQLSQEEWEEHVLGQPVEQVEVKKKK